MSYTRRTTDDGVYAFAEGNGYCCQICSLSPDGDGFRTASLSMLHDHLVAHRRAGHAVRDVVLIDMAAECPWWFRLWRWVRA